MKVVYAKQEPPARWTHAIFLAGPTPRDSVTPSWRPEALKLLEEMGYEGVVFVPEQDDGQWKGSYTDQADWEKLGMELADRIVFWVPRDLRTMPAFTTNVEFGRYVDSGKAVLGHPEDAPKTRYLDWLAGDASPEVPIFHTLESTLKAAIQGWNGDSEESGKVQSRSGGERYVPLHIWGTPMFQAWYDALKMAGNRLDEAEVLWSFSMPKTNKVFAWVLWVKVWISSEERFKENEWVFARTDVSTVVLYRRPGTEDADPLLDTEVVLVREFRSPARTEDGFIRELPGGSSTDDKSPLEVAKAEVKEETGLDLRTAAVRKTSALLREASRRQIHAQTGLILAKERFQDIGHRQAVGTLSPHHIFAFAVELDETEMGQAKKLAESEETQGVEEDTELTYLEVTTVRDILSEPSTDWTTLGLLFRALSNPW
jgi:8-oxo-dGTP pyrophosphatase MutT (NUDIX family)